MKFIEAYSNFNNFKYVENPDGTVSCGFSLLFDFKGNYISLDNLEDGLYKIYPNKDPSSQKIIFNINNFRNILKNNWHIYPTYYNHLEPDWLLIGKPLKD